MRIAPETKLGRYEVISHLATGGMAEVYLARTSGLQGFSRHVVVKRIRSEFVGDPRFVRMFLDEARLAATLHHRNVVQVYDVGQEGNQYFFAMEYVHGEDLRNILATTSKRGERVRLDHALTIIQGAAAGLEYAHTRLGPDRAPLNLVHRDVSPSNLLVGYDGGVKLVDFGIAKATSSGSGETQTGALKGKISYMSPEQIRGAALDRRSDVFSLGILLYELTTTTRLFRGSSDFETMQQIVTGRVPAPTEVVPDYPPELAQIVARALAIRPDERYPSAGALLGDLEEFAARAQLTLSSIALARWMATLFGSRPEPWNAGAPEPTEPQGDAVDAWSQLDDVPGAAEVTRAAPVPAIRRPAPPPTAPAAAAVATPTRGGSSARHVIPLDPGRGGASGSAPGTEELSIDDLGMDLSTPRRPAASTLSGSMSTGPVTSDLVASQLSDLSLSGPSRLRRDSLGLAPAGGHAARRLQARRRRRLMLVAIVVTGIAIVVGAVMLRTRPARPTTPTEAPGAAAPAAPR
ncbi:MAG: serine/threonine-protein kinase [Kofleriaceae bacterium]